MEAKFGPMQDDERTAIAELLAGLRTDFGEIRSALDRLRRPEQRSQSLPVDGGGSGMGKEGS
jgi:hypothetical protein